MKKYLFIGCSILFFGCNDGDLQIETVDFDSIDTVQNCDVVSVSTSNVLFKINTVTTTDIESAVPGNSQVSYRIFSDKVTSAYFCDSPPPLTPTVMEEIEAQGGSVLVTTSSTDNITFTHTIKLSGITFLNEDGSRITDLQINEFGTVTTGG